MKTKVLIIKHDTKAATELRQQLAKNKDICVCDIISDGGNAVSAIRAQNPNVILLDFLLPNLDGLAVMEEVNGWGTRGYRFLLQGNASQIRFAQNTCRGNVDHIFVRFIDEEYNDLDLEKEILTLARGKQTGMSVCQPEDAGEELQTKLEVKVTEIIHEVGVPELDTEGRVVICEFEHLWFVNVYTPNSQNELARIDHRMHWDDVFREVCQGLDQGILPDSSKGNAKPVVMCGDFNVAHEPIDLKNPRTNVGNPGFSDEERAKFTALLEAGFVDTFRSLHPTTEGAYTWWSYRFNARANNAGWRIDYFLVSQALEQRVVMSCIWPEIMGSDHCPISLELDTEGWE